ncbi:nucleoside hydrolase [Salinibacter sp. 10B]|uniref:nucleoside hydrolase n=1 Tax=Salinibacter sp. 10B TaxID=1923971 RepID=UPI001C61399C|nr:nucleoside hydrolase [Salinibacter sp. 10B]
MPSSRIPSCVRLLRRGVLLFLAVLAMSGGLNRAPAQDMADEPTPVVLDTDIGSDIDDTWALAHLLRSPELDLQMVLTATGNTRYRGRVAAKFLATAGRTDVPVALGPSGEAAHEYQKPWVRDYQLDDYAGPVRENGVSAFIELVRAADGPITLIAIGPLPNVEAALDRAPGIASKIHFVGMQGSIDRGYGAGSDPVAEANVKGDVDAFRTVLRADWRSFAIAPLDTADPVALTGDHYQKLKRSDDPMLTALFANYRLWADRVTWTEVGYFDERSSTLFDVVAVYMAYSREHLDVEAIPITVTDDGITRRDEDGIPTRIAIEWTNLDAFYGHLTRRLLSE